MEQRQQPSVGRTVHYVAAAGMPCRAAIITDIHHEGPNSRVITGRDPETTASICVLDPAGLYFKPFVRQDDADTTTTAGRWHWPRRVEVGGC